MKKKPVKCNVCGSTKTHFYCFGYDILYKMIDSKFSILRCKNCNAMFINPFPSQKQLHNFYPKNYYSYGTSETQGFFEKLKKKIIKYHTDPKVKFNFFDKFFIMVFKSKFSGVPLYRKNKGKFLDIGCGSGNNLKIVQEYGWEAYGIELDKNAVEHATKQGLKVNCDSLEKVNFPEIKFDCIRIWHVFEHLTNPQEAIKKIKDLLSDDGEILMAVPNSESWARKIFGKYWYGFDIPRHVIDYCPKTITYICKQNNLKIEDTIYASCGSFVGSISNFLRYNFKYNGNLVNNIFFIIMFSPLDFLSDFFKKGDTIFLTIKK